MQASRLSDGSRRVISITEVTGMEGEVVTLQDHVRVRKARHLSRRQGAAAASAATGILPKFNEKLLAAGIRLPPEMFDEVVEVGGL